MNIFDIFRKKKKPTHKIAFATIGQSGVVVWSNESYEKYAQETYMKNVIAFQCINQIARAVASVPWKLMKISGEIEEEITDWKMKRIFTKPNIFESWEQFIYKNICYYLIKGDAFIYKSNSSTSKLPTEFIALRPDKVQIKTDSKGYPIQYKYQEGQIKETYDINPLTGESDILHIKSFHPLDNLFGMPQLKPASREVDISNEATKWNMNLMLNEARPGMLVMLEGFLTDKQWNRLQEQLREKSSGASNVGRNLILESEGGVTDVRPYSWSPAEIDFIEGGRETARRICIGLGVPPMLIGIPGDNTYSNYKEARAAFWEDTVFYYLNMWSKEYACWLFGTGNDIRAGETANQQLTLQPDLNNIPALAFKQDIQWDRAKESSDILTINERRKIVGFDEVDGGDVIFISASLLPLDAALEPIPDEPVKPKPKPDDDFDEEDL